MALNPHFHRDAEEVLADLGDLNTRFSGSRILLTGAAGFLGVHFIHYFLALNDSGRLKEPCHLTVVDNFARGMPFWWNGVANRTDLKVVQGNIVDLRSFDQADYIIHGASIASPIFYRKHPIETMDANVQGLRNLLEASRLNRPQGFLFFSTSEIYGDPDKAHIPTPETYRGNVSCTGPRACYDESKRYGETLCVNFATVHDLPVTIVRPFNNYGPGLRLSDRRVLPDFFRDALASRDIVMLSDGKATRTFCYSSDAIAGYLRVLLLGRRGESYNIGNETPEISMESLARLVLQISGSSAGLRLEVSEDEHYLTDNPQRRCPDLKKSRSELGYAPKIPLEEGLARACRYYRDHVD